MGRADIHAVLCPPKKKADALFEEMVQTDTQISAFGFYTLIQVFLLSVPFTCWVDEGQTMTVLSRSSGEPPGAEQFQGPRTLRRDEASGNAAQCPLGAFDG
jgi:hypothetical protein